MLKPVNETQLFSFAPHYPGPALPLGRKRQLTQAAFAGDGETLKDRAVHPVWTPLDKLLPSGVVEDVVSLPVLR